MTTNLPTDYYLVKGILELQADLPSGYFPYIHLIETERMKIRYDPAKRAWTLRERGLDFEQAAQVFAGPTIDIPDLRRDYGEPRINSVGI